VTFHVTDREDQLGWAYSDATGQTRRRADDAQAALAQDGQQVLRPRRSAAPMHLTTLLLTAQHCSADSGVITL
jgi:hypothetical protein